MPNLHPGDPLCFALGDSHPARDAGPQQGAQGETGRTFLQPPCLCSFGRLRPGLMPLQQ